MFCSYEPRWSGGLSLEAGCDTLEGAWPLMQVIGYSSFFPWSRLAALHAGQASTAWRGRAQGAFVSQGNPGHKVHLGITKRGSRSVWCDNPWV